jgi:crotonobetaine/carnitine-CoA ligase
VIAGVPGVAEVAVVAMRHPMLDEAPAAFVIPQPGRGPELAEAIQAACASALAVFKRPHLVRLVDSLPRSTLEKVAKAELRALLNAEAKQASASPGRP